MKFLGALVTTTFVVIVAASSAQAVPASLLVGLADGTIILK